MQFYLYLVEIYHVRSKRGYHAFQTVETSETAAIFGRNVVVRCRDSALKRTYLTQAKATISGMFGMNYDKWMVLLCWKAQLSVGDQHCCDPWAGSEPVTNCLEVSPGPGLKSPLVRLPSCPSLASPLACCCCWCTVLLLLPPPPTELVAMSLLRLLPLQRCYQVLVTVAMQVVMLLLL
jgi:hypothetical protein